MLSSESCPAAVTHFLTSLACIPPSAYSDKALHIHFLRSPVEVVGAGGRAAQVKLEKTALQGGGEGADQKAVGTGACASWAPDLPAWCMHSLPRRAPAVACCRGVPDVC